VVAKRGNGEGSMRRRKDGRYEGRYTDGAGRQRSVYSKTRKETAKKLAEAQREGRADTRPVRATMTVREFFAEYDAVARDTMKRRGYETYHDVARLHVLPEIGGKRLADLSREDVQRLYGRKRDAGLSAARVRRIHGVLSSALNTAVRWRYVGRNVCKDASPLRVPQPEIRPFGKDEARRFLDAARGDRYHALYVLGVTSGMRLGELGGLYWSDVDLDRRTAHVQRALVTGRGGQTFEPPKTRGSRRSVGLARIAVDALTEHRERAECEGRAVEGARPVFTNGAGKPINPSHVTTRSFKPILRRAGLPDTTFHAATRHTCTCILLLEGVNPKSVAMQMGWASVAFMLETYARFLPGWGDGGAMDAALG
jgi:integrase